MTRDRHPPDRLQASHPGTKQAITSTERRGIDRDDDDNSLYSEEADTVCSEDSEPILPGQPSTQDDASFDDRVEGLFDSPEHELSQQTAPTELDTSQDDGATPYYVSRKRSLGEITQEYLSEVTAQVKEDKATWQRMLQFKDAAIANLVKENQKLKNDLAAAKGQHEAAATILRLERAEKNELKRLIARH
jgi:hypothetical protein